MNIVRIMADTPVSSSVGAPSPSPSDLARIRRERREAKIKAGGASRLNKITGLGGGLQREEPTITPEVTRALAGDPDEVDISEHFYEPQNARQRQIPNLGVGGDQSFSGMGGNNADHIMNDEMLRAIMLGVPPGPNGPQGPPAGGNPLGSFPGAGMGQNPFGGFPGMDRENSANGPYGEDPMMAMLQQMMGAGAGGPGGAGAFPPFSGMPSMGLPGQQTPGAATDPHAYLWRIVHALFAIGLGIYVAMTVSFTGTKHAREESALMDVGYTKQLFWVGEALLLGRFLFKSGSSSAGGGMIGMLLPMIPQPYGEYIRWIMRYSSIFRTLSGDALLVVFALGATSWWKSYGY